MKNRYSINRKSTFYLPIIIILIILSAFLLYLYTNEKKQNEIILSSYSEIENTFGLGINDIKLTSVEGDFSRGGYLKAEGLDFNNGIIKCIRGSIRFLTDVCL